MSDQRSAPGCGPASTGVTVERIAAHLEYLGRACRVVGDPKAAVTTVTHDSRTAAQGALFACLRGDAFDGHAFAGEATAAGSRVLLVDHQVAGLADDVVQLVVADTRVALGPVAALVAGEPSRELTTIGVTGTNGKTTTAQLVASILEALDVRTGVVGTLHGARTTPEAPELQSVLADFRDTGRSAAVMEVSSHALALHRVDGTRFDVVAFTNFGRDHLDLHGTPEEYFRAKARLFDVRFARRAVINVDDPQGRVLADAVGARTGDDAVEVVEVSLADVSDVEVAADHHRYRWGAIDVVAPLGGDFNVANTLMALSIVAALGHPPQQAAAALAGAAQVPGRFERVDSEAADQRGISVIVDYAHTPDGLEQVLRSARRVARDHRVIVAFGCGGERDLEKRPEMGAVAAELADVVVVTSDNPRRENPQSIIDDVIGGIPERYRAQTTSNPDRRAAIAEAIGVARRGDIVVIAGKGHETSQDLGDTIVDFDDRAVARELLDSAPAPDAGASAPSEDPT